MLIEFPFGCAAWELQSVFYQRVHHLPIVNGYSGGFPTAYFAVMAAAEHFANDPDAAWATLQRTGASHAIVHRKAYSAAQVHALHDWLVAHGATLVRSSGDDWLYTFPRP